MRDKIYTAFLWFVFICLVILIGLQIGATVYMPVTFEEPKAEKNAKLYHVRYLTMNGGHIERMEAVRPNPLLLPGNVIAFEILEDKHE